MIFNVKTELSSILISLIDDLLS